MNWSQIFIYLQYYISRFLILSPILPGCLCTLIVICFRKTMQNLTFVVFVYGDVTSFFFLVSAFLVFVFHFFTVRFHLLHAILIFVFLAGIVPRLSCIPVWPIVHCYYLYFPKCSLSLSFSHFYCTLLSLWRSNTYKWHCSEGYHVHLVWRTLSICKKKHK